MTLKEKIQHLLQLAQDLSGAKMDFINKVSNAIQYYLNKSKGNKERVSIPIEDLSYIGEQIKVASLDLQEKDAKIASLMTQLEAAHAAIAQLSAIIEKATEHESVQRSIADFPEIYKRDKKYNWS